MTKNEIISNHSTIRIDNKMTLLQRRIWNVLLANAYDELPFKEFFELTINELMQILDYGSKYDNHLKKIIKSLMNCKIEWNILNKDGKEKWSISVLLANAEIENEKLTYSYSPLLRSRLYNPGIYARIILSMQNRFKSKHSLALYELAVDYFISKQWKGETPWISIVYYRKLMGVDNAIHYDIFKNLNRYVIKEPIKEINEKSDLLIEVKHKKDIRKVIAIKFIIKHNTNKNELLNKISKITKAQDGKDQLW